MQLKKYSFFKNAKGEWWMLLPEWQGDPEELQMIKGADRWLDVISDEQDEVSISLSDQKFDQAEVLTLLRMPEENLGGGGVYYLESYQAEKVDLKLWLCEVTRFIFGIIPQKIYFKV